MSNETAMASHPEQQLAAAVVSRLSQLLDARFITWTSQTQDSSLLPAQRGPIRVLFPTVSLGAGLWRLGDDVDLVCVTDNSSKTFWSYVEERIDLDPLPRTVDREQCLLLTDSLKCFSDVAEFKALSNAGSQVRLRYLCSPSGMEKMTVGDFGKLRDANNSFHGGIAAGTPIILLAESASLISMLMEANSLSQFQHSYHKLRCWAESNGIWGRTFGYLDSDCLIWMLLSIFMNRKATAHGAGPDTGSDLWKDFFDVYCGVDLARTTIRPQDRTTSKLEIANPSRGNPVMQVMTSKGTNVANYVTKYGLDAIQEAIASAAVNLEEEINRTSEDNFQRFVREHDDFVKVTGSCWSGNAYDKPASRRKRMAFDQTFDLIVASIPHIASTTHLNDGTKVEKARIWPTRLSEDMDDVGATSASQCLRVVGLDLVTATDAKKTLGQLRAEIASDLEASLNKVDFDRSSASVEIAFASRDEVVSFRIRRDITAMDFDRQENVEAPKASSQNYSQPPNVRFRTASQAISRLRNDPRHDGGSDFEIGWLDRFDGIKWTALDDWGNKATEEEDFVPEHRVRQIRRRDDEAVVWDRQRRLDHTGG